MPEELVEDVTPARGVGVDESGVGESGVGESGVDDDGSSPDEWVNALTLRGRVASVPEQRELPSGTVITTFRLTVRRERTAMTAGSKATSDWMDCVAWTPRARRSVSGWRVGDAVQVEGALRRRFYRAGGGAASRVEVEVLSSRVLRRAR